MMPLWHSDAEASLINQPKKRYVAVCNFPEKKEERNRTPGGTLEKKCSPLRRRSSSVSESEAPSIHPFHLSKSLGYDWVWLKVCSVVMSRPIDRGQRLLSYEHSKWVWKRVRVREYDRHLSNFLCSRWKLPSFPKVYLCVLSLSTRMMKRLPLFFLSAFV